MILGEADYDFHAYITETLAEALDHYGRNRAGELLYGNFSPQRDGMLATGEVQRMIHRVMLIAQKMMT